jgi:D-alanyl-D-alanine dipeptidase
MASAPAGAGPTPGAPADFVALHDVEPSILQDIRYTTAHNFIGDPTADPRIDGDAAKNRLLLTEGLEQQGFVNYDKEWWHFTYSPPGQGEPYPDTYFDFPVDRGSLTAG